MSEQTQRSPLAPLAPRIARMKERLLTAQAEICLARARAFTSVNRELDELDQAGDDASAEGHVEPGMRNALALERTLSQQAITLEPEELIAGSKTEKFLAGPLSVERGDFLRSVALELDILERKRRPFAITESDRRTFRDEILPYWSGRTVRDRKVEEWERQGLITAKQGGVEATRELFTAVRFLGHVGWAGLRKLLGANLGPPVRLSRLRSLASAGRELAANSPTPATTCFDVQGHLCLGVDHVVTEGMESIMARARARLAGIEGAGGREATMSVDFLRAVICSLEAAIAYSERFACLAEERGRTATDEAVRQRLEGIAERCRRVPRHPPRTFHEALQAAWMAHVVGEIQYGTHDVFAAGRVDQFLYPLYRQDRESGGLQRDDAAALVQEYLLKLSANVEPIPEAGMEANGVLGNSQHNVTIGGVRPEGGDGTNELSWLILDAYEALGGSVNQLCVRIHRETPDDFLRRAVEVCRTVGGIAFYNDDSVVSGMVADGFTEEDARDYCIVGCVETCGQSNCHPCPGGHELVLPAVLMMALTEGRAPARLPGQRRPRPWAGSPERLSTFDDVLEAFRWQLREQLDVLIKAVAAKDRAHRDLLPAPYVSALMDGCIESARDITNGGARYDFTSLDLRGLATLVDSLLALKTFAFDRAELSLSELVDIVLSDFEGEEALRQRIIRDAPKYGTGSADAESMTTWLLDLLYEEVARHRNIRGGLYRLCYYSYGNHVIDGILLGATPDGRRRGEPISNGVSVSNLAAEQAGVLGPLQAVPAFPPEKVSSGVSLNLRFHPKSLEGTSGVTTFASMVRTYFELGGMQLQPNVVSTETLRDAQLRPEQYRDLIVKVAGYSAHFVDLGQSIQEDIIARAEVGLA